MGSRFQSCTWIARSFVGMLLITQASTALSQVFINEFHYDNSLGDVNEGVEIAGPAGRNLSGWIVELYNGATNGSLYDTIPLTGFIDDEGDGFGTLWFSHPGIQNGGTEASPHADALALVDDTGAVVEFLSYEGEITASSGAAIGMLSTDIGVAESSQTPVDQSLQRTGVGSQGSDFSFVGPRQHSRGNANDEQTFVATEAVPAGALPATVIAALLIGLVGLCRLSPPWYCACRKNGAVSWMQP